MNIPFPVNASARYDTFNGLIPCRIVSYDSESKKATIMITKSKRAYRKGELIETFLHNVIPVRTIRYRNSGIWIMPHKWQLPE